MQTWLPQDLLSQVDLSHLNPLPTAAIHKALGDSEAIADFLFETKFSKQNALVYFLIEHKSYRDKFVPLQAHVYQASAWLSYHRNNPGKKLPLIFTIVLHHGKKPYLDSTDLRSLIDAPPELVDAYVLKPFHLVDLSQIPDEAITGTDKLRAIELIMKHIPDRNILAYLEQNMLQLLSRIIKIDKQLALILLDYVFNVGDIDKEKPFYDFVAKAVAPIASDVDEGIFMGLGERIEWKALRKGHRQGLQLGLQQGRQEGRQESLQEVAKRMLASGVELAFVSKITGLSQEELSRLQQAVSSSVE